MKRLTDGEKSAVLFMIGIILFMTMLYMLKYHDKLANFLND